MNSLHARVAIVFSALILAGCSDLAERVTAVPQTNASVALAAAARSEEIQAAIAAQERHTNALMRMRGVVGTAVGLLPNGKPGVQVLVLDATVTGIPERLDNIPVQRVVTGMLVVFSDPRTRLRPAPVGFSVGHPSVTAGTIGARVVDAAGAIYVLSNNHVLANQNDASIGNAMLQPGPFDGGRLPADQIGTLAAFNPLNFSGSNNLMDAAIALTSADNVGNSTPLDDGYGTPDSRIFGDANNDRVFDNKADLLNLPVQKYGRTTRHTRGNITSINATVNVCYEVLIVFCVKSARFVDQLIITKTGFSGGGDSGSLIVTDNADKQPVALLFGGSEVQTIANRIDLVLNYFNVTVDGSASEPPPPPDPVSDAAMITISGLSSIEQGRTVAVGATVRNAGNQPLGAFDITMVDQTDGVTIGTAAVAGLDVGQQSAVTFSWNTTGSSVGAHTLVASHDLADDNAANNQVSRTVQITAPATPFTDLAAIGIEVADPVTQGAVANVDVIVRNVGNQPVGAFDVTLEDQTDGVAIGTQTVSGLAAGATTTVAFSWNTAESTLGSHTLSASHNLTDDGAGNNQFTRTVQVNEVNVSEMHVGNLDGTPSADGQTSWSAIVEVAVHDALHLPLNGATVVGTWSISGLNSDTCTTGELGGNGTCIFLFPNLKKGNKSVTFTVTSVTMDGRTYQASLNHDPDGSSNGTSVKVDRP